MLHVEVHIPGISKSYEFSVNEHVRISLLIQEMMHIISQKEQRQWEQNGSQALLCNCSRGYILPEEKTLYQCKVQPGSRLMLL